MPLEKWQLLIAVTPTFGQYKTFELLSVELKIREIIQSVKKVKIFSVRQNVMLMGLGFLSLGLDFLFKFQFMLCNLFCCNF